MLDKIHKFIYLVSALIVVIGVIAFLLGMFFFNFYKSYPNLEKIFAPIIIFTPFAPIGTLFGTLKDKQSVKQKLTILVLTLVSMIFLLVLIFGMIFANAFAN